MSIPFGLTEDGEGEVRDNPASRRLDPSKMEIKTSRAWKPKLWALETISLALDDDRADGAKDFRACRMWVGATLGANAFVDGTTRSIAPRRTSNKTRTSPV
jgi:hypothetical protein